MVGAFGVLGTGTSKSCDSPSIAALSREVNSVFRAAMTSNGNRPIGCRSHEEDLEVGPGIFDE